jgi:hypothetical protein
MIRVRGTRAGGGLWYNSSSLVLNRVLPSLIHKYDTQQYYNAVDGETAFPFTAVRVTNAMMFNGVGKMVWAPVNMAIRSAPGDAGFLCNSATSTLTGLTCPTGQIVNKIVADAAQALNGNDASGGPSLSTVTTVTNQTYCMSFYAKAAEISVVRVREPSVTGYRALIDLTTGSVIVETGTSSLTSGMITTSENAGDGWWRIICRRTVSGASQGFNIKQGNTTGDGVSGVYLSSFQFEPEDAYTPKAAIATTGTAYYGPRFDRDPVTGSPRGLFVEDARTNLCLNSHTFQTGWTLTNCSLSTLTTDPMGLTFGRTILEGPVASTALLSATFTTVASTQYAASVYFKRGNTDWVRFRCVDGVSANGFQCWANLATGAIGTANLIGTGTYVASSAKITALSNGWYRVSMAGTIGVNTTMRISTVTATGDASATNVDVGTYEIWGAQVELLNESSYIPTYTASATRAIDSLLIDIPAAIVQSRGTWHVSFIKGMVNNVSGARLFGINDGTLNNGIELFISLTGQLQYKTITAGVSSFVPTTATLITSMAETKVAAMYLSPSKKGVIDGGTVATEAVTAFPTSGYTKFFVGASGGTSSALNGWIQEIRYYADATATDAQLQAITT